MGSANTRAALATKHRKELIFRPAFDAIGISVTVAEDPETRARQVFAKGIDNLGDLRNVIKVALADQPHPVIVEPDLRAHHCPDRRRVIGTAVERLVQRLQHDCPRCNTAGFGPIRVEPT